MSAEESSQAHERDWPALGFVADNHRRGNANMSERASDDRRRVRHPLPIDDLDVYEPDT